MVVVGEPAGAVIVSVGRLRAVGGDQVVAAASVRGEHVDGGRPEALGRERLTVGDPALVARLGAGEERCDRGHPSLRRPRRDPDPLELAGRLDAAAVVEVPLVDRQLDAVCPERIRVPEGKGRRHHRVAKPERARDPHRDRRRDVVVVDAVTYEVVVRERLDRDDLDGRVDRGDAVSLDAPDDRDAPPVELDVAKGIADRHRDLVPQLGRADGVADQEDVRHRRKPNRRRRTAVPLGSDP